MGRWNHAKGTVASSFVSEKAEIGFACGKMDHFSSVCLFLDRNPSSEVISKSKREKVDKETFGVKKR